MVQRFYGNADGSLFSSVSVHAKGVRVFAGCEIERATMLYNLLDGAETACKAFFMPDVRGGTVRFGRDNGRPERAVGQQVL